MTLSDDEVVGNFLKKNPHSMLEGMMDGYPVTFRDLDKLIQDRLRAAEELAEAASEIGPDEIYEGECRCGVNSSESPDQHKRDCDWRRLVEAIAAYQATYKETRGKP